VGAKLRAHFLFSLRMPHKTHTRPRMKRPITSPGPAATTGVPVPVAGIDAAIGIDALDNGNMAETARALHPGLQHNDRRHMWTA